MSAGDYYARTESLPHYPPAVQDDFLYEPEFFTPTQHKTVETPAKDAADKLPLISRETQVDLINSGGQFHRHTRVAVRNAV